ncbi:HD domain-containing protein [Candidatus Uhrbacteria bacterium]|nr:HD domain-containing protein [Candidatus Uhrbacteria bacterium]
METVLGVKFEEAVHLLAEHRPVSDEKSRKPAFFHDIRVGVYLYEKNYSDAIVLAGLLHDAIEWYGIGEETLRKEFGDAITDTVVACTKDDTIKDQKKKIEKIIKQCVAVGKDALIVKAADIIDSYAWYTRTKNVAELTYCDMNATALFEYMPSTFQDKIFDELRKFL